jgi:hypothetical protein
MFSDTSHDVITPSKLLRKISPVPKVPRRNLTARRQLASVLTDAANIEERRKKQRGIEVKRAKEEIGKKSSNQETPENSDTNKCCECWENYFRTTKEDDWIECVCVLQKLAT